MSKTKNTKPRVTAEDRLARIREAMKTGVLKHWDTLEVRTTRDVARQMGITVPEAYKLCSAAEEARILSKYGYRVHGGWEDVEHTGHKRDSLGWQMNEREFHCASCSGVLTMTKKEHDGTVAGECPNCKHYTAAIENDDEDYDPKEERNL